MIGVPLELRGVIGVPGAADPVAKVEADSAKWASHTGQALIAPEADGATEVRRSTSMPAALGAPYGVK